MTRPLERVLVIGASGQVGAALVERLGPEASIPTYARSAVRTGVQLELAQAAQDRDLADSLVEQLSPTAVICAAGLNDVDGCEGQLERALAINCEAPARFAAACARRSLPFVYYSSEYVFDGFAGPYREADALSPTGAYGRSKAQAEVAIAEVHATALILRTTVVYGPDRQGKNFAYRLASTLAAGERIRVPNDQISTPTYNRDLARATVELLRSGATGIYHACGFESMSRVTFARRVAVAAGLDPDLIVPVATSELEQRARRPLRAGLDCNKLRQALPSFTPLDVEQAVRHWLASTPGGAWWRPDEARQR